MLRNNPDKIALFLHLVALLYGVLGLGCLFTIVFPIFQNGESLSNTRLYKLDSFDFEMIRRSFFLLGYVMDPQYLCMIQSYLVAGVFGSFFTAIAAIYYGIRHRYWRQGPESSLMCDYIVRDVIPKFQNAFCWTPLILNSAFALAIFYALVLFGCLMTELFESVPRYYLVAAAEIKLLNIGVLCTVIFMNLYTSCSLQNKLSTWNFLSEEEDNDDDDADSSDENSEAFDHPETFDPTTDENEDEDFDNNQI